MACHRVSFACLLSIVVVLGYAALPAATAQTANTLIQGTVSDQITGASIVGALLKWNDSSHTVTGTTNSAGAYAFAIPLVGTGQCEKVAIQATGNLYTTSKKTLKICAGTTTPVNFTLTPLPANQIGTVSGQVLGNLFGKSAVANATVSIYKLSLPVVGLVATTNARGFYSVPGVGFSTGLTIKVSTSTPPCISPISRNFSMESSQVTENFSENETEHGSLVCPPNYWAPDADGSPAAPVQAPPRMGSQAQRPVTRAMASQPSFSVDPLQWELASADGILMNASANSWNSGHINDIVKVGSNEIVVGANMSGAWDVSWSSASSAAAPLSWFWPSLGINSLVPGVDGTQHIYAGTGNRFNAIASGFLFETDTSAIAPLTNWVADNPKPACNDIFKILTIPESRLIVLACDNGIWWSPIPPPPAAHGTYSWKQALPGAGVPPNVIQGAFEGLAEGPVVASTGQVNIAAATNGAALANGKPHDLLFYGSWLNGNLYLNAAKVAAYTNTAPGRTSIASCETDQNQLYAVTNNIGDPDDGFIGAVWRSQDGGKTWTALNIPANSGNQGDYNQAIAVNPLNCLNFAIAWRDRVSVSYDGGTSYVALDSTCGGDPTCQGNLHGDYHAVMFDPDDVQTLWVGEDGGVASANPVFMGSTPTFNSIYNEHLSDLEVFTATASSVVGTVNGNQPWGLVAATLQDNGDIYNDLGGAGWWNQLADSDGISAGFSGAGPPTVTGSAGDTLVFSDSSDTQIWTSATWSGTTMQIQGAVPPNINAGGPGVLAEVRGPKYSNAKGELMYEIGSGLTNRSIVYGLFSDPTGGDLHWEQIGDVGTGLNVSTLSSTDGNLVFAGTDEGKIFTFTPQTGIPVQWPINPPAQGSIQGISEIFPTIAFAALNNGPSNGYVVSFNGTSWSAVGGLSTSLPFLCVTAPNLGSVFAADPQTVYVSHDLGTTWLLASNGLPLHDMALGGPGGAQTLRWAVQSDGLVHLYLASRGWSVFQAVLPAVGD